MSLKACLIGLAAALLLVGVVSGTLLRHVVQILPIVAALLLVRTRPAWGAYAALPLFVFWFWIVIMIWLFVFGLSRLANGTYTTVELALTIVMAVCSAMGAWKSVGLGRRLSAGRRLALFVLFAVLQLAAMWVSFLKPIANR
jgi:hypothetical protein